MSVRYKLLLGEGAICLRAPRKKEMSRSAVLSSIISRNKDTEIGKKYNFSSIKTIEDYRNNVPLSDYEDYRSYIERMVEKGEENLLSPNKVTYYSPTSGTTSSSKLIPKFTPPGSEASLKFDKVGVCCILHIRPKAHHLEYPSFLV